MDCRFIGLLCAAFLFLQPFYPLLNATPLRGQVEDYFADLESLKKRDQWQEIVERGERAQAICQVQGNLEIEFQIVDQLVSTYFRLGEFNKAYEKGKRLRTLALTIDRKEIVIDSLYKLSAAIRGLAGNTENLERQKRLFIEARELCEKALMICRTECPKNLDLLAKALFNCGAAEADDSCGDLKAAVAYYREALRYFHSEGDEDYTQRTMIRLAKASFLLGEFNAASKLIEELKKKQLEQRTLMHLYYLEAQVERAQGRSEEALNIALKGQEIAWHLGAKADLKRFEIFIASKDSI